MVILFAASDVRDLKGRRNGGRVAFSLPLSLCFSLFPLLLLLCAFLALDPGQGGGLRVPASGLALRRSRFASSFGHGEAWAL